MSFNENVLFWFFTAGFALSFFIFCVELVFKKPYLQNITDRLVLLTFIVQTAFVFLRWASTGHFPYVTSFESIVISCWFIVLFYIVLKQLRNDYRAVGIVLLGFVFILLGYSTAFQKQSEPLSVSLQTLWLVIHAFFATSGIACLITGTSFALLHLKMRETKFLMPMQRFVSLGFIFWSVMILSGSIWANQAWGRYWGWDPIETWSLISWLIYGAYFHVPFVMPKFKSFRSHYLIFALFFALFALWGVTQFYKSVHVYG